MTASWGVRWGDVVIFRCEIVGIKFESVLLAKFEARPKSPPCSAEFRRIFCGFGIQLPMEDGLRQPVLIFVEHKSYGD
ncbi:MAG: hypothetical protein PHE53_01900 [Thermoguttaceae bacterium]|nr:hypothetical protein [Thermoguttaceae bacterium]